MKLRETGAAYLIIFVGASLNWGTFTYFSSEPLFHTVYSWNKKWNKHSVFLFVCFGLSTLKHFDRDLGLGHSFQGTSHTRDARWPQWITAAGDSTVQRTCCDSNNCWCFSQKKFVGNGPRRKSLVLKLCTIQNSEVRSVLVKKKYPKGRLYCSRWSAVHQASLT